MHFHIGFFEFLIFGLYLFIWKAVLIVINLEMRRNKLHVPSGMTGFFS
jgi:hypothetical protein